MEIILRKSIVSIVLYGMLFSFLLTCTAIAQTEVEGEVSGEWNQEGSPYLIVGDANVPEDEELRVLPGTEIVFEEETRLFIDGTINAEGGEEDSIYFRGFGRLARMPLIMMESAGNSLFQYVHFDSVGVEISCSLSFLNNLFLYTILRVRQENNPHPLFEENVFTNRSFIDIHDVGNYEINGNIFSNNSDLSFTDCGYITLRNIQINSGGYLRVRGGGATFLIEHCELDYIAINGFGGDLRLSGCSNGVRTTMTRIANLIIEDCNLRCSVSGARDVTVTRMDSGTIAVGGALSVTISDCDGIEKISGNSNEEIRITNNHASERISVLPDNISSLVAGNIVDGRIEASGFECEVTNNIAYDVLCKGSEEHETNVTISNNRIKRSITCEEGSQAVFLNNDIGQWQNTHYHWSYKLVTLDDEGTDVLFRNNTFYETEDTGGKAMMIIKYGANARFENNLIMADGNGAQGVELYRGGTIEEQNNVFWGFDTLGPDWELSETSRIVNPRIMDRHERNIHLQAVSPLINTGDRQGRDPDGSRNDIGCFYFNHRENYPPFIDSPFEVEADVHTEFVYAVVVTDDGDNISVTVDDLPDWLEIVERDNVEVAIELRGQVPEEWDEEYHFFVRAEDAEGLTDSLSVQITVNPSYLLYGDLPDRLELQYSPYIVTEHIVIPEDDALTIEPGVELKFRQYEDVARSASLSVLGPLHAIGNEDDPIVFSSEFPPESRMEQTWPGIFVQSTDPDSTILDYCQISGARHGVYMQGNDFTRISHSIFQDNRTGIYALDSAKAIISENSFFPYSIHLALNAYDSDLDVEGNYMFDQNVPDTIHHTSGRMYFRGSDYRIRKNIFQGKHCGITLRSGDAEVYQNQFLSCHGTLSISNDCSPRIYNNIFSDIQVRAIYIHHQPNIRPQIFNNIFANCDSTVVRGDTPEDSLEFLAEISHNLFFNNQINFYSLPPGQELGILSDVNVNNDSCDAYQNIFLDPEFVNWEDGDFHLTENSPCIDAGIDIGLDFAGDAPDIGLFEFGLNLVEELRNHTARQFQIISCYPNPFNSTVSIGYSLEKDMEMSLSIFDLSGREITVLNQGFMKAGHNKINWKAGDIPSGVYFARLESSNIALIRKLQLLK